MRANNKRTDFGSRLVRARKSAGLTQAELALRVGVGQSTIADSERLSCSSSHVVQLAQALGVTPEWLATGQGERLEPPPEQASAAQQTPLFLTYSGQGAATPAAAEAPQTLTPMAVELATLFDLLTSRVERAMAYSAATQAILSFLTTLGDAAPTHTPGKSGPASPGTRPE